MHYINARIVLTLFVLCLINMLFAGTTGKIVGIVKDKETGAPLIGANVVLVGTNMGASTDADGYYVILNVPPGTYRLDFYYVGYATHSIKNVKVRVDRTTTQHIKMSSKAVEGETVVVQGERPAIEMDRTHSSAVVSSETAELMPVTEVEELIKLQAGVVEVGGQLHFRGGRTREVSYVIDGVPVNNSFSQSGGSLVEVDNNMIAELEVISGTFNAEYGQAQSGVVNIVTKRPASKFSGTLKSYTGDWLSGKNQTFMGINDFDPVGESNIEFSLTGPIFPERLGFVLTGRYRSFENLEWFERRFNTMDGWRIAAYRKWAEQNNIGTGSGTVIPIPDSLATGDGARGPLSTSDYGSLQAKLTLSISPAISLNYTAFGSYQENQGPFSSRTERSISFYRYAPDDFGTSQQWSYSHFLRLQHTLSDKLYYNLAASYQREDGDFFFRKDNKIARYPGDDGIQLFTANSSNSSGNTFSLGGTNGMYTNDPDRGYVDQYLIQGDINWQIDKHNLIKAGFSAKQIYADVFARGFQTTPEWRNRMWPLNSDQVIAGGDTLVMDPSQISFDDYWRGLVEYWRTWDQTYGDPKLPEDQRRIKEITGDPSLAALYRDFQVEPREFSAYVQDKLEMGDIIINGGLRLDYVDPNSQVPINFRTESFNLGAQSNLTDAEPKFQISPRFGISFPISSNGAFHGSYGHFFQMPPYQRMFNEPLNLLTRFQLEGRRLGNADLDPEKTIAYEIGLQQAITDDIAVDVTAYYKDFRNLLGIEQLTTIDGVTYERYINRDYGNSKGVTVDITKRHGMVNGGINYTLAYANGSSSDPAELFLIQTATRIGGQSDVFPERKILYLDWDQRHTVNAFINFVKSGNWSVGLVGFLVSGTPFSPDFLERFDIPSREYRNEAFKPSRWGVDLKAKKHLNFAGFKTALFLEIENLFDNLNHERVDPYSGQADQIVQLPEEHQQLLEDLSNEGLFTEEEVLLFPGRFSDPRKLKMGLEFKF